MQQNATLTLVILTLGVAVAGLSAARLLSNDITMLERLHSRRNSAAEIPVVGSLTGRNALDGNEWPPRLPAGEQETYEHIVLFPLFAVEGYDEVEHWREIAVRVLSVKPHVKFVGVCHPTVDCKLGRDGGAEPIILLSAMDPLQMRALAIARSRKVALLFQGNRLQQHVLLGKAPGSLADEIANIFASESRIGTL